MKLTRRQEEFVQKMIELKQEFDCPVHYSLLAERLGVSPFTAYDMLCLLEEKGYMTSRFQLPSDKSGPGRAERFFYPGEMAQVHENRMMEKIAGAHLEGESLKEFILEKLRQQGIPEDEKDLVEQLMARLVPVRQGDVDFCVEVMTVAALRLRGTTGGQVLMDHLPFILSGESSRCRSNLSLFGGFVFGILSQQMVPGQEWLSKLREHVLDYLDAVNAMDSTNCNQLEAQLIRVFAAIGDEP